MSDVFVYECAECGNAIVDGYRPVTQVNCPACGSNRDEYKDENHERLFIRRGRLK